ncbi:MAG: hypothetical protein EA397_01195 [Deltaproteobacteria bacterium]|nr:MAG: hypothetical protein EA397_01195 [Deltaproteobacteria bacterium]
MILLSALVSFSLAAPLNDPEADHHLELDAELGFLAPLSHKIQFGQDGSRINYIAEGGQDNLFAFFRPTARFSYKGARFTALWQPLDLRTTAIPGRDLQVNERVFPADTPMDFRYGFSFWRLGWEQRVFEKGGSTLHLGLGLQIRNATISFVSTDGALGEVQRDIGPVPLLKGQFRHRFEKGAFIEVETDGFYAPIRYLNARDVDVEGAIADLQVRAGLPLSAPAEAWLGLRYLGGGASGTGTPQGTGDGFTVNWLHTLTLTLGLRAR